MRTFPAFHHLQLRPSPLLRALGSWDFAVFLIDCLCNYKFRCKFSASGKMAWWGSPNLPPPYCLFSFSKEPSAKIHRVRDCQKLRTGNLPNAASYK